MDTQLFADPVFWQGAMVGVSITCVLIISIGSTIRWLVERSPPQQERVTHGWT